MLLEMECLISLIFYSNLIHVKGNKSSFIAAKMTSKHFFKSIHWVNDTKCMRQQCNN